jgi:NO-binding membrane sensor protein with MHYT domain
VAEIHHFTYGVFNPVAAYLVAFLGSLLGLMSTGRAREARTSGRRNRWLVIAAFSIGGGAIWLMHFTAMLGFDVPMSPVRYNVWMTALSLMLAVITVGAGLIVVGHGRRSVPKVAVSGVITGFGVLAMHYTGMRGLHVAGEIHYRPNLVVASGVIAIVATTVALWFTVSVKGWLPMTGASAVMAIAVCGMHYTGMAATWVELQPHPVGSIVGIRPLLMIVPITIITAATILGVALSGLQAMTEEEFDGFPVPRPGSHAGNAWSLKQASAAAIRKPGGRPSPRPIPARPTAEAVPAAESRVA